MKLAALTLITTLVCILLGGWSIEHHVFTRAMQWWALSITVMLVFLMRTSQYRKQRLTKRCQHDQQTHYEQ